MEPTIKFYSHLEERDIPDARWFPESLTAEGKVIAKDLRCLELHVDKIAGDAGLSEQATSAMKESVWRLCQSRLGRPYLVMVEHLKLPKSRVRSHKGLLQFKDSKGQAGFIEREIAVEGNRSFFMGLAEITVANKDEYFSLARDRAQAFILLAGRGDEKIDDSILERLINCISTKSVVNFDYMKLVPEMCKDGFFVLSFVNDMYGQYLNATLFFEKDALGLVQEAVKEFAG